MTDVYRGCCAQGDSELDRAAAVESLAVGLVSAASDLGSHANVQALAGAQGFISLLKRRTSFLLLLRDFCCIRTKERHKWLLTL